MTHFTVTVTFDVIAPSRQQAESWVQAVAINPFAYSRRGTGQIVRTAEQKERP